MSLELHAALGFLQAIHYSAKVARVNTACCRALSRAVGKIRPVLEEIDMAEADGTELLSLATLAAALENVHIMIVRFSAMGQLQAVLGSEAMFSRFSQACQGVAKALEGLLEGETKCLSDCEEDIRRICVQLRGLKYGGSTSDRQLASQVRNAALQIIRGETERVVGHKDIRNMLYGVCRYAREDMALELQGLERERSRAKAEKDELEVQILQEVILALEGKAPAAVFPSRPQPPVEYLCPISKMIMSDPVVLVETGQTYDRHYIEQWFRMGNRTCPITKLAVRDLQLTPNYALKSLASTWVEVHGGDGQESEPDGVEQQQFGQMNTFLRAQNKNEACINGDTFGKPGMMKGEGAEKGNFHLGNVPVMEAEAMLRSTFFGKLGFLGKGLTGVSKGVLKLGGTVGKPGYAESFNGSVNQSLLKKGEGDMEGDGQKQTDPMPARDALEELKTCLSRETRSCDLPRQNSSINPIADGAPDEDAGESTSTEILNDGDGLPPRPPRLSLDAGFNGGSAAARWRSTVNPSGNPQSDMSRMLQQRLNNLTRGTMSKRGELQVLSDVISSSRQSLELHRRPRSPSDPIYDSEDPPSSSHEVNPLPDPSMSGSSCTTAILDRDDPDVNPAMAGFTVYRVGMDGSCDMADGMPGGFNSDAISQASFPYHPCSISCCSDSSIEEIEYLESERDDARSEIWIDSNEFDASSIASLSTIAPSGITITPSISFKLRQSRRPSFKAYKGGDGLNGATNLLFDEAESECGEGDDMNVSTPVLVEMVQSGDADVAVASANELALRAYRDPKVYSIVQDSNLIERLVAMLAEGSDAGVAAARTLGTLGESQVLRVEIVKSGAFPVLSEMTRIGSSKTMDIASWAMNQLSREKAPSGARSLASMSVEVSTPMLVQMLLAGEPDVQACGVLDLKERLLRLPQNFEDLTKPDAVWTLVDMLEHDVVDVQLAAATLLSLLVFRSQEVHQQVATRAGTVIRLVRLVKDGDDSCAAAAAQVLRTLAHSNSGAREEMLKRGIVPALEHLLGCPTPEAGAREVAAWLLGILGSHTEESQDLIRSGEAVYLLQNLFEVGQPQEIVAASWALQSILSDPEELGECEVSIPLVIESLQSSIDEIKVASAWELCHLANGSFWVQMEIFNSGGLQTLLDYLKANPATEGSQAALVALAKMAKDVPPVPAAICREGGVPILVGFLRSVDDVEKHLAVEVLTVLADRCPLHQPEVVTEGAVSVLAEMLNDAEPTACMAAYNVLSKLANSEMSAVVGSMASISAPILLKTLEGPNPAHSKEAAARVVDSIASTAEGKEVLLNHGGMPLLMKVMENGETYEIKKMAGNAVTKLAKKDQKAHVNLAGSGAFGTLVQLLQSASSRRRTEVLQHDAPGDLEDQPLDAQSRSVGSLQALQHLQASTAGQRQGGSFKTFHNTMAPTLLSQSPLPVVPESAAEESDCEGSISWEGSEPRRSLDDTASHGSGGMSALPTHVTTPLPASSAASRLRALPGLAGISAALENAQGQASSANSTESNDSESGEKVKGLVDILRMGSGSGREQAAARLRSLAQGDKLTKLELVKAGAVPLMVELLQSKSFH
ncbi:hypothetical protein BSKO_00407 [Bryopsis sp. KO-2023]|nr:hypothetical protein BSKO_00407 [Bryopsis sp. KO-2023]